MSGRYFLLLVCVFIASFFFTLAILEAAAYGAVKPHKAPARKVWICPETPDGFPVFSRSICVLEVR